MQRVNKYFLLILILFLISTTNVWAEKVAYVEEKNIATTNAPSSIRDLGANGTSYYPERANYYEFIKDNNYNVIFELDDDKTKLGWITTDLQGKVISEKTISRYLSNFGAALYYNNYLYVLYGTTDNETTELTLPQYASTPTIALVKYNLNGSVEKSLLIEGYEMSAELDKKTINDLSARKGGTRIAFDAGTADLVASNGIIAANFAREMYSGHQMAYAIFVDANSLKYLNRPSEIASYSSSINYKHWVSHSFDQRILATSDNEFLLADQGDAYPRSFVVSKTSGISNPQTAGLAKFDIFHFREAADKEYAYNNTFANLGNIIELDDGYLFVAASEKTLSINYAKGDYLNEPRNIFIQKLDKNFSSKTAETIQKFSTAARKSETSRTDARNKGQFNLSSSGVTDYGVKWLTNYSDNTKTVLNLRAVKLDNGNIAILWGERPMRAYAEGYSLTGSMVYYYMIIDSNGNIVKQPLEIQAINLSSLIHFNTQNNCIYWTQEADDGLTLYKLDTTKDDDAITFERVGNETIYITDNNIKSYKFSVKTNKDTPLKWSSSDRYVATVDDSGNVTILKSGTTTITVKNEKYNVSLDYKLDVKYKVEEIELISTPTDLELVEGNTSTITYSALPYSAYDRTVSWQSSNDEVVSITRTDGTHVYIKALQGGKAKIIGTTNDGSNIKVEINVNAIGKMTSLSFEESNIYMRNGETYQLKPIVEPKTANEPLNYLLSSYNTNKITISEDGVVTAGGMGHAEYMVLGKYSKVRTYINIYSYDTILDVDTYHLDNIGDGTTLHVTTYPQDNNPKWESLNDSVVTVDSYGRIKAVGNGVATIKVTASNGYSDTCVITVGDYLPGDLDKSGVIDMPDVYIALKIALHQATPTDEQLRIGDIDGKNGIDMPDVYVILKTAINVK